MPVSFEHAHTYDTEGRVVRVLGAGYQIGYRYDAVGRQRRIGLMNGSTWIAYVDYVPGPTGRVDHATFSNGVTTHVDYDALARLARIRTTRGATSLFDATYGYLETFNDGRPATDARSLITSITYAISETYVPADSRAYWYDGKRRLLGASYSSAGNADYEYEYTLTDEPSRLKTPDDQGVDVTWANSRPTHIGGLDVDVAPNGSINRIGPAQAPEYTFERDRRDRVTAIGGQCVYSDVRYTPLGLRARYTDAAGTHLEFDDGPVLVDAAADGTVQRVYVFAPDGFTPVMILQKEGDQLTPYFVHNDHLATPQFVTDATGTIVWKARYEPYGKLVAGTEARDPDGDGDEFEQPIRLPGQFAISGPACAVYYNKARYFIAKFGVYESLDAMYWGRGRHGDSYALARYAYSASDPVNTIDPSGLYGESYNSKDWAGMNAVDESLWKSEQEDTEYCGLICENLDGTWYSPGATKGWNNHKGRRECDPGPWPPNCAASWHTHTCESNTEEGRKEGCVDGFSREDLGYGQSKKPWGGAQYVNSANDKSVFNKYDPNEDDIGSHQKGSEHGCSMYDGTPSTCVP